MEFERTVLANGLRVLSRPTPDAYGARVRVSIAAGATLEPEGAEGVAHLAEHMAFKGTPTLDAQGIARAVERRGGEIDAFTDHYETTYIATQPGPALADIFPILADMLARPRLDPADLEKERSVIIEELRTYEDEPSTIAYQAALAGLWRGWPQGRPVGGRAATVARLSEAQVRAWFAGQYGADRMVIGAAGAVEHRALVALAERHLGDLPPVGLVAPPLPTPAADGPRATLHRRESEQVAISLAMPAPAETDPALPAVDLLAMLLGGNDCARLFARLRDELGLVYGVEATLEAGPGTSQIVVTSECAPGSVVTVLREIEAILDGLVAAPPAADEVADARAALQARWLLPFDAPTGYADWLAGRELWHGRVESPRAVAARFDAVTPADVHAAARAWLARDTRHLALVGALARTWRPTGWTSEVVAERGRRR